MQPYKIYLLGNTSVSIINFFGKNYEMTTRKEEADILLVRSADVILSEFPKVKVIARLGKGIKNIPIKEATEKGILVVFAKDANATAVTQFVIRSMLDGLRNFYSAREFTTNIPFTEPIDTLDYSEKMKKRFRGRNTEGLNIGLIGAGGDVCRALIPHLDLFGMNIFGNDIVQIPEKTPSGKLISPASIDEIVECCDVISVHADVPMLFQKGHVEKMKDGLIFIDYARGVSADLDALRERMPHITAYSDFSSVEWLKLQYDFSSNVFVTPHGAGLTDYAEEKCVTNVINPIKKFIEQGVVDTHSPFCINAKEIKTLV